MDFLSGYAPHLTVNGVSRHTEGRGSHSFAKSIDSDGNGWNENNGGIGLSFKKKENDTIKSILLGNYKNSIGKDSFYGGMGWQKRLLEGDLGHLDLGGRLGLVTGYEFPVAPMIQPMATVGLGNHTDINIGYQPKIDGITPEVWMFNADYRLK